MFEVSLSARHQRARLIFESAEQLAEASAGSPRAVALARLDFYRQATYWGLAADAPGHPPPSWSSLMLNARGLSERVGQLLIGSSDADEALDDSALASAVDELRGAARAVLEAAETPERLVAARDHWRVVRRTVAVLVALAFVPVVVVASTKVVDSVDLAKGKPWRASSKLADCHPERIECGGVRTRIFFHTLLEKEPWVEIDLQAPTRFSAVAVHNRTDDVQDRAVPLVLEVSDDQRSWRQLARRDELFKVWRAEVPPTTARYVRLRSARDTLLHFEAVKVYP